VAEGGSAGRFEITSVFLISSDYPRSYLRGPSRKPFSPDLPGGTTIITRQREFHLEAGKQRAAVGLEHPRRALTTSNPNMEGSLHGCRKTYQYQQHPTNAGRGNKPARHQIVLDQPRDEALAQLTKRLDRADRERLLSPMTAVRSGRDGRGRRQVPGGPWRLPATARGEGRAPTCLSTSAT
jgi:hypothetical protein